MLFYKKINLQKLKKLEKIRKKFKILRKLYTLLKSVKYSKSGKGLEVHEVATGLTSRNDKKEIYEKIELQRKIADMYEKVISSYEKDSENNHMKVVRIDATKSIEEIEHIINETIKNEIK